MSVRRSVALAFTLLLVLAPAADAAAKRTQRRKTAPRPVPLQPVWHVETLDGEVIDSKGAEQPINPASVVKVATSLWALEQLGPDHRFETRFSARGRIDADGVLQGDLVVHGTGDPDFQIENGVLVAAALNRAGIRGVHGRLLVNGRFWIGYENGSGGTLVDEQRRGVLMASRLRQALDPQRWPEWLRRDWREIARRHGLDTAHPPRVAVSGAVGVDGERGGDLLLVHRSSPLVSTLRRFNCYSNNDIERVAASLGPPEELAGLLRVRLDAPFEAVRFATTSGLGVNRLSPRLVVRLLREFRASCQRSGVAVEALLPVAGCDPGTVGRFYPRFAGAEYGTALVGKTGTLTSTDGGVSVLAGFLNTAAGEVAFCIAVPRAGGQLRTARQAEERWLLDLVKTHGGPAPRLCAPPLADRDIEAELILVHGVHAQLATSPASPTAE